MLNTSNTPKNLNLSKIILINYLGEVVDLSSLFIQLNIYESIFSPVITGDILINDGINLLNNFPIICQEKIIISFSNPDFEQKELVFNVTSIKDIKNSINNDKVQNYILHFSSSLIIKNKLTYISRCLQGKADDIILDLLTKDWSLNYKGGYKLEKSDSYLKFVVPYWEPFKMINYITNRAIPENRKYPTYLFYQDLDNFNFISYDSLLEKEVKESFYYAPANTPTNYSIDEKSKNINKYSIDKYIDLLNMLENNTLSNQYIEIDLINKKYNVNKLNHGNFFENSTTLYDNDIIPVKNIDNFNYNEDAYKINTLYNFIVDKDLKKFNKYYLYRKAWLDSVQNIKIKIEITENTDRKLGDLVNFNIPSREKFENKIKYADFITGKFIISKIRHTIGNDSIGISSIELIKDSFSNKLPEEKIVG